METIHTELQKAVNTFLSDHPGIGGKQQLADKLYVSIPTVERWSKGRNLPSAKLAATLIEALKQ
jgi:transcriptional regulator with XRE-family HTH domain